MQRDSKFNSFWRKVEARNITHKVPLSTRKILPIISISCLLLSGLSHGSCSAAASTSLTIDGGSSKSITETIAPNETKYVSSNVTYSANDVQDYTLKISYANGSSSLKLDGGSNTINGVVDNTTGSNISDAWGYSWTDGSTAESSYANLLYNSIPTTGTKNIETGTTISSTTKKMIFAANLSDSNPTGHYKANVLLSLVATPKATMGWNDLVYMQDMTPAACTEAPRSTRKELIDKRDQNKYYVVKLDDDRCWMQQDLKIAGKTLTPVDSDISTDQFILTASNITGFSTLSTQDGYASKVYIDGDTGFYNWYTATAGAGTSAFGAGSPSNSICPKGWTLPTGGTGGEYETMLTAASISNDSNGSNKIAKTPYNFNWSNGFVENGAVNTKTTYSYWWSSTADSTTKAHVLSLYSSGVNASTSTEGRYYGFAIRCVAAGPTNYRVTYKLKTGDTLYGSSTLPAVQAATTTATTQEFTVQPTPTIDRAGSGGKCYLQNWLGNNGKTYTPDEIITLTADKPELILTTNELITGINGCAFWQID